MSSHNRGKRTTGKRPRFDIPTASPMLNDCLWGKSNEIRSRDNLWNSSECWQIDGSFDGRRHEGLHQTVARRVPRNHSRYAHKLVQSRSRASEATPAHYTTIGIRS